MFVEFFIDIYENHKRKNFIKHSCLKHPKIIEIINDINIYSHVFLVPQKSFMEARGPS